MSPVQELLKISRNSVRKSGILLRTFTCIVENRVNPIGKFSVRKYQRFYTMYSFYKKKKKDVQLILVVSPNVTNRSQDIHFYRTLNQSVPYNRLKNIIYLT